MSDTASDVAPQVRRSIRATVSAALAAADMLDAAQERQTTMASQRWRMRGPSMSNATLGRRWGRFKA